MQKSDSIKNLAKGISLFHVKMDSIKKDSVNPFFKNKYASLSAILDAINVPLSESGLTFIQLPEDDSILTTILMHAETGEFIAGEYSMKPAKEDPQGRGSALTYQRRYALCAILGLNIEDDDDANAASQPGANGHNKAENNIPWLNEGTKEFDGAVTKIRAGQTTIEKIKTVMRVSKATEQKLIQLTENQPA